MTEATPPHNDSNEALIKHYFFINKAFTCPGFRPGINLFRPDFVLI